MTSRRITLLFAVLLILVVAWQLQLQAGQAQTGIGTAAITSPTEGSTVSGKVTIKGTATITDAVAPRDFQYYKLEYTSGSNPWVAVDGTTHSAPVTDGTLATWDTSTVTDGWHRLRAVVVDNTGQWGASSEVSVLVNNAAAAAEAAKPRRGCTSCHTLRDPATGKYTLWYEATSRAAAGGGTHPTIPRDASVSVCLACHARGTGDRAGKGVVAPLALSDIVHPAHMFSEHFVDSYKGNCFTCHNVNAEGVFELLPEMVEVTEKGIPEVVPIPGRITPP